MSCCRLSHSTQCIQKGRTTSMPSRRTKKIIFFVIIVFCAVLILNDRYYWAQIAQWREDQATNLWLGYTVKIGHMPVGLISSKDIPNPNGMLLLGSFLSFLPSLLSISFFLSLAQAVLLLLVGWKAAAGSWQHFMLAALPTLSSDILRST